MKGYKFLMPIAMIACILLSAYMLYSTRITKINEYNDYLSKARNFASQGIAVDAVENYSKALELNNSIDIQVEVGDFFVKMEDIYSAIGWGEKMVEQFPNDAKSYEFLLARYRANNDYNRCYTLYNTILKREIVSDNIETIMNGIKYVFYYGEAYDNVKVFCNGYCPVQYEGKWGYAAENGERVVSHKFLEAGSFINDIAPVVSESEEAFFIDNQGNKKVVVQNVDNIKQLTSLAGGCFAAYDGTQWTFYNKEYKELSTGYTNVSLMQNSVVAVEKDGYWYLLNDSFEKVNSSKYADIVQDEIGIVCRNDRLFVNEDGSYYLIDKSGNKISNTKYEAAHLFNDDTYAAVRTDKGWTFIDVNGKEAFKNTYFDDARSFSNGYAAVKKNGKWGFINAEGKTVIECQFEDAKEFNASGCAFVKTEDIWRMILLYSHNYES